jgi:hypothetical protein
LATLSVVAVVEYADPVAVVRKVNSLIAVPEGSADG